MIITIDRNNEERQCPIITIDTRKCYSEYAVRNCLELALELEGYSEQDIDRVFNLQRDLVCKQEDLT
jgi:hypothetical protein